jgi:hypothetical protein
VWSLVVQSEHQRIGSALDVLTRGLLPFFEKEMRAVYGEHWEETARACLRGQSFGASQHASWDAYAILNVMWEQWNTVFRYKMGVIERSLVGELREFRNRWAHQAAFSEDDSYRVLDSTRRLLLAAGAIDQADEIEDRKLDVLRSKLGRHVNEELARVRFNRARMTDVALYLVCCLAILTTTYLIFGTNHFLPVLLMSGFTVFVFGFLIYQRATATAPVYGVHECPKCSKVIYSEVCPYCDPPMRSSIIVKNSSLLRVRTHRDAPSSVE